MTREPIGIDLDQRRAATITGADDRFACDIEDRNRIVVRNESSGNTVGRGADVVSRTAVESCFET